MTMMMMKNFEWSFPWISVIYEKKEIRIFFSTMEFEMEWIIEIHIHIDSLQLNNYTKLSMWNSFTISPVMVSWVRNGTQQINLVFRFCLSFSFIDQFSLNIKKQHEYIPIEGKNILIEKNRSKVKIMEKNPQNRITITTTTTIKQNQFSKTKKNKQTYILWIND